MWLQLDACYDAHVNGTEVQHPLLDRVRQCSSNPEQAALFFCQILNPVPKLRQQAIHHAWCAETVGRMFEDIGIGYEPCYGSGSESDDGSDESNDVSHVADTLHQGKVSRCAALRRCFGCLDRPKVQETDEEICRMEAKAPGDHHSAAMPHPVPNSGRMRKCMQTTVSAAKSAASKIKFPFAKTARSNRGKFTQPLPGAVSAMELPVSANQTPIAAPVSANQSPTAAPVGANQPPTAAPVGANQPPTAAPDVAQQPNQAAVQIKAVRFSSDAVPISLTAVSTDGRVSQPSPARLKPQGSNGQTEHQAAEVTNTPLLDSEPCRETQDAPAAEPQHQSLPASESTSADR